VGRSPRYLGGVAAVVGLLAVPAAAQAANGFTDGVTAGDVGDSSAIIWARTTKPESSKKGAIALKVESVGGRHRSSVGVLGLNSTSSTNKTVQTKVKGLQPGKTYRYQFCLTKVKHHCSDKGTFRTAPKRGQKKTIRFAYSGDETGIAAPGQTKPFWGNFKVWKTVVGEHNDFNIDFGDTIYSDPEVPGARTARTVKQKWAMYRKKLAVKNMRLVREKAGMYNHWDDHEFINDFSIPEFGRKLYDHSVRAFRDYMPVHYTKKTGIYRTERWGKNLELFFLDERSFRSAKASANGTCDNPAGSGSPDLAPTAPQSVRDAFGALVPSLKNPVPQSCLNAINSPKRTMLGANQLKAFLKAVKSSTAKWKVVMNEVPIQQFYALPYDRWEGYAYERIKLLNALESAHVRHLVFLTTDTHASFANVIRDRTFAGDSAPSNAPSTAPSDTPYQDFITGPVATKPFAQEINDTVENPAAGPAVELAFFKPQPPGGVGMSCYQGDQNSYVEVTASSKKLKLQYRNQDGGPVVNPDTMQACGPYVLTH
jgi:alkaline phosphatase D